MKKILKYIGIIAIVIIVFNLIFNSYFRMRKNDGYVLFGYSGLYKYFNKEHKKLIYWKEFYQYDLMGTDKEYLLYGIDKKRIISVDKKNVISDKWVENINEINIISANSNKEFKVSILDNNNVEPSYYNTTENIFAVSDIEGDFDRFIQILQKNHVINNSLQWNYGKGHLVLLGDFFDRGNDVTAVLWLCYQLEQEAEKQGGKVHFILGNHEQMNLRGNMKYVDRKYKALSQKLNIPYKELYGKNSELGRWIRSKNAIEIINNMFFVHGGISPDFIKRKESVDKINQNIRFTLDTNTSDYYTEDGKAKNNPLLPYIEMDSPLWYRGYFQDWGDYKKATQSEVDAVCKYYEVNKIIVGHTIVEKIKTHYNGKVIGIDITSYSEEDKNKPSALLIENNNFYAVDELGRKFPIK